LIYTRHDMVFMSFSVEGWGDFKIAKILPKDGNPWGAYAVLPIEHPWRSLISEVSEESVDLALSGHPKPLLEAGIRSASACLRLAGLEDDCSDKEHCLTYKKNVCSIRSKKIPDCFSCEGLKEQESYLAKAWLEGYSILILSGAT